MTDYNTRPLTADESEKFQRDLHLALGKSALVDSVLGVIANSGLGIFVATEVEHGPYFVSDEDVQKMHPRQAAVLMTVEAEDRGAVTRHAHFLMNVTGGNLSGNLHTAVEHLKRAGSAEALMQQDRDDNAALMRGAMRNR